MMSDTNLLIAISFLSAALGLVGGYLLGIYAANDKWRDAARNGYPKPFKGLLYSVKKDGAYTSWW